MNDVSRNAIDLDALGLYSPLISDFLHHKPWISSRFAAQPGRVAVSRTDSARAIQDSMDGLNWHPSQQEALDRYVAGAECIVSGQQVGLLGGPLYTIYKIATTISRAREVGAKAVSVFWVEDNDHDIEEACKAWLYTNEQGAVEIQCMPVDQESRRSVGDLSFGSEVESARAELMQLLVSTAFTESTASLLDRLYVPGNSLSDAFIAMLHELFASHGVLFIKASVCRKSGLMKEIVAKELGNPGAMAAIVTQAGENLSANSYHVQAEASFLNLFYHDAAGQRLKIQQDSANGAQVIIGDKSFSFKDLETMLAEHPNRFSPSVLLRPVVQDAILGTHSFIGGPSELAYMALLQESYAFFGYSMPHILLRSGATVLTKRYKRMLDKDSLKVESLLRPWDFIEKAITDELVDEEIVGQLERIGQDFDKGLEALRERILAMDGSLEGSCGALKRSVEKELAILEKKVRASARRKHEEQLRRVKEAHRFIFPDGGLQERKLSPIYFYNEGGAELLAHILQPLLSGSVSRHYCVDLSNI